MAEVTLADYTGFIFRELIRAREMADAYSRQVAEAYAQDPVMKHFSVPRFKVPRLDLTIPVLISGARFAQSVQFVMPHGRFVKSILAASHDAVAAVRRSINQPFEENEQRAIEAAEIDFTPEQLSDVDRMVRDLAEGFLDKLRANPDATKPAAIADYWWRQIFETALSQRGLIEQYRKTNPANELYARSREDVLRLVLNNTIVKSTAIQSLLVNPETNIIKNGSDEASMFVIKAEMIEEGFFIRSIKDEKSGETRPVVEFE